MKNLLRQIPEHEKRRDYRNFDRVQESIKKLSSKFYDIYLKDYERWENEPVDYKEDTLLKRIQQFSGHVCMSYRIAYDLRKVAYRKYYSKEYFEKVHKAERAIRCARKEHIKYVNFINSLQLV